MWVDGGRIDNIATMADLQITSLETRKHTQEGANEVVDGSMRLERATAPCWRCMTLRLRSCTLTPGLCRDPFDQDMEIGLNILSWTSPA